MEVVLPLEWEYAFPFDTRDHTLVTKGGEGPFWEWFIIDREGNVVPTNGRAHPVSQRCALPGFLATRGSRLPRESTKSGKEGGGKWNADDVVPVADVWP